MKNTDIHSNWFSPLNNLVGDILEVQKLMSNVKDMIEIWKLLSKTVKHQNNSKEKVEEKEKEKKDTTSYHADSVETNKMDNLIKF